MFVCRKEMFRWKIYEIMFVNVSWEYFPLQNQSINLQKLLNKHPLLYTYTI